MSDIVRIPLTHGYEAIIDAAELAHYGEFAVLNFPEAALGRSAEPKR